MNRATAAPFFGSGLTKLGRVGLLLGSLVAASLGSAHASPTTDNEIFVAQAYADLLARPPSAGESTAFVTALGGGASRTSVALQIDTSNEYYGDVTQAYYNRFLGRAASPAEINTFAGALALGTTDEQVIAAIVGSVEFRGGLVGLALLDKIYQALLNRGADAAGQAAYLPILGSANGAATVAASIEGSLEYRGDLVDGWFGRFLHRGPLGGDDLPFIAQLTGGATDEDVIAEIVGSNEYFDRALLAAAGPGGSNPVPVSEPAALVTLLGGCLALAMLRRRDAPRPMRIG